MKIKTYEARTEQEAIEKVREEFGGSAIILTIKKISPKGIFKLFRKEKVEVTAAQDDGVIRERLEKKNTDTEDVNTQKQPYVPISSENLLKDVKISEQEVKIKNLEKMLIDNEELLKKIVSQLTVAAQSAYGNDTIRRYDNTMLQLFYDTLTKNGVLSEIAITLLSDLDTFFDDDDTNINIFVKLVYNRILQKLGEPNPICLEKGSLKLVVFMGPTGVGKTTTIAKLASHLIISHNMKVGLVTADTYRIAAVEQLKIYGDILGVNVEVVYTAEDLKNSIDEISSFNDVIFIDTAGRSHKNEENFEELKELLAIIPDAEYYLVLSSTTKYEDLKRISRMYSQIGEYSIIFTKIDETSDLGSVLNLCYETGIKLSYLTYGQNVPDDIKIAEPTMIARALLGSFDN